MPFPFGFSDILVLVLLVAVVVIGIFVYQLYQRGVPRDQIAGQVLLRAGDVADDLRDRATEGMREWARKAPGPDLKAGYWDKENFDRDAGRVLAFGYHGQMVRLDGRVVIDGDNPPIDYLTQSNGNVTRKT